MINNPPLFAPRNFALTLLPPRLFYEAIQNLVRLITLSLGCLAGSQMLMGQGPSISSVAPAQGPIAGGTVVTIKGLNLQGGTVSFGNVIVASQSLSGTEVSFTTPAHDNGIASVRISTPAGDAYGEFLFVPPLLKDLPAGYITTVAGIGQFIGFHRPATQAEVTNGCGIAFDLHGNTYLAEPGLNMVSVVRQNGVLEPFAGTGNVLGLKIGNGGAAVDAELNYPRGVTTDSNGNVYIPDQNQRVWRVNTSTGIATIIAGNGTAGYSGDGGPAINAVLGDATMITGDGKGTIFFIDYDQVTSGTRIRRITPDGIISTVAGNGIQGFSGDGGLATLAEFNLPSPDYGSLALDPAGNLYIADSGNFRIRRIDGKTGIITTVAGPKNSFGETLFNVYAVAVDPRGNIYYAYNPGNTPRIVEIDPGGVVLASYGKGPGNSPDGTRVSDALLGGFIASLAIDPNGNIVFSDGIPAQVRRLNLTTGLLETVAGVGLHPIGENGPAVAALLGDDNGDLAFLPTGELLLGDSRNALLRKIDQFGNISTIAGYGIPPTQQYPRPALGTSVYPIAVKTDISGQIYLADTAAIFRIDLEGNINPIAGAVNGQFGYSGDGGPALVAELCQPWDMTHDSKGNLFIADTNNNRIRRVDAKTGIITTVAGSGPLNGFEHYGTNGKGSDSGDGGPALQATLNTPYGIAVDSHDNLFISSGSFPQYIRKVDQLGIITTFATVYGALSKLTFDSADNIYVIEAYSKLVRYDPSGKATTLAGSSVAGFSGDGGPASRASLTGSYQANGIAIDAEGNIFFVDGRNYRVRAIRLGAPPTPKKVAVDPGRLINLAILTPLAMGETMTMGTVLGGAGTSGIKPLLVRAAGPALAQLGVSTYLPDPTMTLNYTTPIPTVVVTTNNDWAGAPALSGAFTSVGAFPYASTTSKDAALFQSGASALAPGKYTVQVSDASGGSGTVIAEIYDASGAAYTLSTPRLINVAVLKQINAGATLTAGFVIGGSTSCNVLIRAIGPGLTPLGVGGVMPDPQLTLTNISVSPNVVVATNNDWAGNTAIAKAANNVGAFPVSDGASKDAMLLVALAPGNYTAQVNPVNGTASGLAIVEVYEVP